jgi:uncharacterized protein
MVGRGGRIRSEYFVLPDFHTCSHSNDVARLEGIVAEARAFNPVLVLLGGDFVNMQLFGAGRVAPKVIAAVLARLGARYGQFAVLGNHDYLYGAQEVADALRAHAITVLEDERRSVKVKIIRLTSLVFRMPV